MPDEVSGERRRGFSLSNIVLGKRPARLERDNEIRGRRRFIEPELEAATEYGFCVR